ncbi:tol-pal system protein YbgF [Paraglaciecola psychrophila]|uniref:Cell division coordinator CpoB n=1 Tax=Paraglaciecola psychrophila 170 TaxID=1129794 RepID=K6ZZU4_9ALTE|nr:tol-pal system protein YbgF [Paraglaciecola psychrophila]AGH46148.1 tol-pal system protein YbgF [Paraglaciecola psychrophila 170]GAC35717.1 TPR domain-containing protein [Paraglaciecola psychrophila 170]
MIKRTLAISLLGLYGAAVNAAPAPVTDVTSGSSDQRITELERKFSSRTEAQHRQQEQLDTMQNEVNQLRGSIEVQNYQLEKILERQRELYFEIDKRIQAVRTDSSTMPIAAVNLPVKTQEAPLSENENEAYDKAVNLILKDRLYEQAIPEFQTFLQNFPNSSYVPNAHYWLGQLLFNKQDWAGAGEQFQLLIKNYPDSSKRADATLKLGISEMERSNAARAKQLWEQVVAEFPDSSSAKLAEKRLKGL